MSNSSSSKSFPTADWKKKLKKLLVSPMENRKSVEKAATILSNEAAIRDSDWPELVEQLIDKTEDFGKLSEDIYGTRIDPLNDEGGLVESYTDNEYYTIDLAFNILSQPAAIKSKHWERLVLHTLSTKEERIGSMDCGEGEASLFIENKKVMEHPSYKKIKNAYKAAYPFS